MKRKIILSESELIKLIKNIVSEQDLKSLYDENFKEHIILVSGLNSKGFKPTKEQVEIFKKGLSPEKLKDTKVYGFDWQKRFEVIPLIAEIEMRTGVTPYVFLFSKAGEFSLDFVENMNNKTRLFIVEPYNTSPKTLENVINALDFGVPHSNLLGYNFGPDCGRGCIRPVKLYPNYQDYSKTPKEYVGMEGHWKSLSYAASIFV